MKSKLSVALATYNEEDNIKDCLLSVKNLADEIIVVDGSSADKTADIAKKLGAKVIKEKNRKNFHINKQIAIDACSGDWILQLDADERVSPELTKEIRIIISMTDKQVKSRKINPHRMRLFKKHQRIIELRDNISSHKNQQITAFYIPRINYFLDRFLAYGGAYPDGVIRLAKKGSIKLPQKDVHGQATIKGQIGWLENNLLHYADPTFSRYLTRSNRYTTLQAEEYAKQKIGTGILQTLSYFTLKPTLRFLSIYIRHKGFMDGFPGFVFAVYSGLHITTSYVKYWEKKKLGKKFSISQDWA